MAEKKSKLADNKTKPMEKKPPQITAQVSVCAPVEKIWQLWTTPADIMQWNVPGDDWLTPKVENDVRDGGAFLYRMEMKNGSFAFDFTGTYDVVIEPTLLEYTLNDGRKVINTFTENGKETIVTETFEPEKQTPADEQKAFCLMVLNSFKKYTERKVD